MISRIKRRPFSQLYFSRPKTIKELINENKNMIITSRLFTQIFFQNCLLTIEKISLGNGVTYPASLALRALVTCAHYLNEPMRKTKKAMSLGPRK